MYNFDITFSGSPLSYFYNNNLDSVDAAPIISKSSSLVSESAISHDSVDAAPIAFAPSPSVSKSSVKSKIKRWSAAETAKLKEIIRTVGLNWKEVASRMQECGFTRTIDAYSRKYRKLRSQKLLNEANKDLTKAPTEERVKHVKDQVSFVTSLTTESSEIIISPSSPGNSSISSSSTDTSLLSLLDDSWISTLPVMPFSAITIPSTDSSEVIIDPSSPSSSSINSSSSSSSGTSLSNLDDSWTLELPMMPFSPITISSTDSSQAVVPSSSSINSSSSSSTDTSLSNLDNSLASGSPMILSSNTIMLAKPVPSGIIRKKWARKWTEQDDQRLLDIVNSFESKAINWQFVAEKMKKNNVRCRERYFEVLDPTINKTPLSIDEMNSIIGLVNKIGTKWSEISRGFPGRTPGKIKRFWNSKMRSKLEKDLVSSNTSLSSSSSVKRKLPTELTEQSKKGKLTGDISTVNNLEEASSNFLPEAPWNLRTDTNAALT